MQVHIDVEHDGDVIEISANVVRDASGQDYAIYGMQFSKRAPELIMYFMQHPSRMENIRTDLISKAIRCGA